MEERDNIWSSVALAALIGGALPRKPHCEAVLGRLRSLTDPLRASARGARPPG